MLLITQKISIINQNNGTVICTKQTKKIVPTEISLLKFLLIDGIIKSLFSKVMFSKWKMKSRKLDVIVITCNSWGAFVTEISIFILYSLLV